VVTAPRRRDGRREVHVRHRSVVAVGQDQQWTPLASAAFGGQQVARQRPVLEWDAHHGRRGVAERQAALEQIDLAAIRREQAWVAGLAVQRVIRRPVKAACAQEQRACAAYMATSRSRLSLAGQTLCGDGPRGVKSGVVAVADLPGDRSDLAVVGAAVGDVGDRPMAEVVVKRIAKYRHGPAW